MNLPKGIAVCSFPKLTENGASFSESISKALCPRIHFWNSIEKNVRMLPLAGPFKYELLSELCMI